MNFIYLRRLAPALIVLFVFIFGIVNIGPLTNMIGNSWQRVSSLAQSKLLFVDKFRGTNRSLTVVTAYFDIGNIPKGSLSNIRTTDQYKSWMNVFRYLNNPLVVFTDSDNFTEFFTELRKESAALTKIVKIAKESLWSFEIKPQISQIYDKPNYPKYYPITYIPEFTSIMHSKLTVVGNAIRSHLFPSDYYCWLDVGYFRDLLDNNKPFFLEVPDDLDVSKVGVTRVYDSKLNNITARDVILGKMIWIGGGLFLGSPDTLLKFELQYKDRVMYYLSQELMGDDQAILYAMYTRLEREKNPISVEVQTYIPGTKSVACSDPWFYLGCLMYQEVSNLTQT